MASVSHLRRNPLALDRSSGCRISLVRVASLLPLVIFLRKIGAPWQDLLESSGIPTAVSEEPDAFVPLNSVNRLVERVACSLDLPDLGARVAAETSAFCLAYLGPALRRAVTVYDYLQIGAQLIGQVASGERFWMTLEKDMVRFHHQAAGRPCGGRIHADMYCMAVTVRALREALGPSWCPAAMDLVATDFRTLGELDVFGDSSLRLGQPHSSFTMPLAALQQQMPVRREQDRVADAHVMQLEPELPQRLVEDLEAIVGSLLAAGAAGSLRFNLVAESAGMSARTLQRRLEDCGATYSDVVHRTRVRLASDWLRHTRMPIREISTLLGYNEPANFTRAFRRTTGVPPQQFRRSH